MMCSMHSIYKHSYDLKCVCIQSLYVYIESPTKAKDFDCLNQTQIPIPIAKPRISPQALHISKEIFENTEDETESNEEKQEIFNVLSGN